MDTGRLGYTVSIEGADAETARATASASGAMSSVASGLTVMRSPGELLSR
jgi:hypothetical protein